MDQLNFLFGAGEAAQNLLRILQRSGIKIHSIIDNDVCKQGREIDSVKIISFPQFLDLVGMAPDYLIFISTIKPHFIDEIKGQLYKVGINQENIIKIDEWIQKRLNKNLTGTIDNYNITFNEQIGLWTDNLLSEVRFWMGVALDLNNIYHGNYMSRVRSQKDRNFVCRRLEGIPREIKDDDVVIDVGCGLCPQYGFKLWDGSIQLISIDPLAYYYNFINGIMLKGTPVEAPVIKWGMFELLSYVCSADSADFILIDNALDHCIDPFQAILEGLKVVKKEGCISLQHNIDEGLHERFLGLHQWNICTNENHDLVFWNLENLINISKKLEGYAKIEVSTLVSPDEENCPYGKIIANITKIKELPDDFYKDYRVEITGVIEQLMRKMADPSYCRDYLDSIKKNE